MLMLAAGAAAAAAVQPAAAPVNAQHPMPMMQMGHAGEHKDMDCCKHCSEHMAAKHGGGNADHAGHQNH